MDSARPARPVWPAGHDLRADGGRHGRHAGGRLGDRPADARPGPALGPLSADVADALHGREYLDEFAHRALESLSHGTRQRIAIVSALLHDPEVFVIDEPMGAHHGGDIAAPVFKRAAEQILRYMSVPPDVPSYAPRYALLQKEAGSRNPEAGGRKPEARSRKPENRIYKPGQAKTSAPFWFLASGSWLPSESDIALPDFYGKSLREVTEECLRAGLRLQSIGSGAAVEQVPPAGATVRSGSRVQVRFSSKVGRQ